MLTNRPESCLFPGSHKGKLHEYTSRKFAELDGTPVKNAPEEVLFICEGHYPDPSDPTFSLCSCRLCLARKARARGGNGV